MQPHGGAPELSPWDENYGRQRCSPQRDQQRGRADRPPMALRSVPLEGCVSLPFPVLETFDPCPTQKGRGMRHLRAGWVWLTEPWGPEGLGGKGGIP